jgi:hypothetical protein
MKLKFTHKEFTLLLGILVAVIIMITLWFRPFSLESGEASENPAPGSVIQPAAKLLIGKSLVVIKELIK